jgi:surface antigen
MLALLLATATLAGLMVGVAPAAHAASIVSQMPASNTYPWPTANPDSLSPLRYYYRNCTDYAAYQLNRQAGVASAPWKWTWGNLTPKGGHAYQWRDQLPHNSTPAVGSVAWWGAASWNDNYGHVAIVTAVWDDGYVNVQEYNYGVKHGYGTRTRVKADSYLHVQDVANPPAPVVDRDSDGIADGDDLCPDEVGLARWWGCQESGVQTPSYSRSDVNGDGRGDYCRVVGGPPGGYRVTCSLGGAGSFATSFTSNVIDVGYRNSYAWADVTGDNRADYCRLVGGGPAAFQLRCSPSTGAGFGSDWLSGAVDPGYPQGRAWVDVTGDQRADYCRAVGMPNDQHVQCTLSGPSGFGQTITSPVLDWGYTDSRWWSDVNGDRKADFCRIVGGGPAPFRMACTLFTGTSFGATWLSNALDVGYVEGRAWVDVNGDRHNDYCRVVGMPNDQHVRCTLTGTTGFGADVLSPAMDWGYTWGRWWADVNGDLRGDYCRAAGDQSRQFILCTLSTGGGFGATWSMGPIDWGYAQGRAWLDQNGDGRADYCRVVGVSNAQHVRCTLSGTSGFGSDVLSPALDWGYLYGRLWAGGGSDSIAAHPYPVISPKPTITGTARVGRTLTCSAGSQHTTWFQRQWLVDGQARTGATASTFYLGAGDLGRSVACRVRAGDASLTVSATSAAPKVALGAPLTNVVRPSISGYSLVGKTLTARVGSWSPTAGSYRYQWQVLKGGAYVNIYGASARTYAVPKTYAGKYLRVRVIAVKPGHANGSAVSPRVRI